MLYYRHDDGLYANVTNVCPTACAFCVKTEWDWSFRGQDLRLGPREPAQAELIAGLEERLGGPEEFRELVFCGFGEPTMRLGALIAVARRARSLRPGLAIRVNTVGLGSLVHGRDIAPELARAVDSVSISLNTADPAQWRSLHRPRPQYREAGFDAVLAFAASCVAAGLRTRVTAVERTGADLDGVRALAAGLGADFLARPALSAPTAP